MNKWGEFVFNEPYRGEEINKVNNIALPKQFLEFMKLHNGGEGDIGKTWLVLFPLEELQEINKEYCMEEFLPKHVIIGSNGGEELYGLDSDGNYFNVPSTFDEDDLTILGDSIDSLPERINQFWK